MNNLGYKFVLVLTSIILVINCFAIPFVSPIGFKGTENEKKKVIEFIKQNLKHTSSSATIKDSFDIGTMEKEELNAFENLTKVKDKQLLNRIIKQYKINETDDYLVIWKMYQEQEKSFQPKTRMIILSF